MNILIPGFPFTNEDMILVIDQTGLIKKIKGLPYIDFIFKIIDIANILKPKREAIKEKIDLLNKERTELILCWCKKDGDNKPIVINGNYLGLDRGLNPEYDTSFDKIMESFKELEKQRCEFSDGEKERLAKNKIDKKILENKIIKEEFNGDMYEAIGYFLGE